MDWFTVEESFLAPYAMRSRASRGRHYPEEAHPYRTVFQRDRERIVHCSAFRRLMGKTQVLVGRLNDHHRTRLTHTLEVAQVSRTIARRLRLNEDLTEAIALAHDMGHPPFGHAGEQELNDLARDQGGFDHNLYGLRRVDVLEERYPDFPGLNLSWELREAFVQHSQQRDLPPWQEFRSAGGPLLEAQVVDAADSLAYDAHDTDDALGIGLISVDDLHGVELWRQNSDRVRRRYGPLDADMLRAMVVRELIAEQAADLVTETEQRLEQNRIASVEDVRRAPGPLVGFSPHLTQLKARLEAFLQQAVYHHHRVQRMARKGRRFLRALYGEFTAHPELLPPRFLRRWAHGPVRAPGPAGRGLAEPLERVVVDYLAGMTDRFAEQEYLRLFHPEGEQ